MKLYDISQEVFTSVVYPGDAAPVCEPVRRMADGDPYNLTNFAMCAHNGTHIDAPFHFIRDGKTVDQVTLERAVGPCRVAAVAGRLTAADVAHILSLAGPDAGRRIILKGDVTVTSAAATAFAEAGVFLVGVESQSVGEGDVPAEVHRILLGREVVLLEGLRLDPVAEGNYFLCAAPLSLGGADGAPCRALLIDSI